MRAYYNEFDPKAAMSQFNAYWDSIIEGYAKRSYQRKFPEERSMSPEELREAAEVMRRAAKGEPVRITSVSDGFDYSRVNPSWNWSNYRYEIIEPPKLEPIPLECGMIVKWDGCHCLITEITPHHVYAGRQPMSWEWVIEDYTVLHEGNWHPICKPDWIEEQADG